VHNRHLFRCECLAYEALIPLQSVPNRSDQRESLSDKKRTARNQALWVAGICAALCAVFGFWYWDVLGGQGTPGYSFENGIPGYVAVVGLVGLVALAIGLTSKK
jgi:hypothetical protein